MKQEWKKVFTGRSKELNDLKKSWEKVREGGGPHIHVVRGERGMGKTRLVQEFYRYLSKHEDEDNYWPDNISYNDNTLLPTPDPNYDDNVKAHFESFTLKDRILPFLWWGFRIADPNQRNSNLTGLDEHSRTLSPHLVPLTIARDLAILRKKNELGLISGAIKDIGEDLGSDLFEGLLSEIPGISFTSTLYSVGKRVIRLNKEYKEAIENNEEKQSRPFQALYDIANKDVQDRILDQVLLLNPKKSELIRKDGIQLSSDNSNLTIPVIIFIDDAQFCGNLSGLGQLHFLAKLWRSARSENLPILLVATHWNYEWEIGRSLPYPEEPEKPKSFVEAFFPRTKNEQQYFSETILGRDVDLGELLDAGLPSMPDSDRKLILDKSDGNPMLLFELLELLADDDVIWRDQSGLTDKGKKFLSEGSFEIHSLIVNRLKKNTPSDIRKAVLISAVQGTEFFEAVTLEAASALNLDLDNNVLRRANSPHALINFLDQNNAAFIQRAVYEAALSLVDIYFEDKDEIKSQLKKAKNIILARYVGDHDSDSGSIELIQNQLNGLEIGLGLESKNIEVVDRSLKALEQEIESFRLGISKSIDHARASELAERWWQIVQKLELPPLKLSRYMPAFHSLNAKFGATKVLNLTISAMNDALLIWTNQPSDNSRVELGDAIFQAGETLYYSSKMDLSKEYVSKSVAIYRELNNKRTNVLSANRLSKSLILLGKTEQSFSQYEKAEAHFKEGLNIRRTIHSRNQTQDSLYDLCLDLDVIGFYYFEKDLFTKTARKYFLEIIDLLRSFNFENDNFTIKYTDILSRNYINLGDIELKLLNYQKALNYYLDCLKIYRVFVESEETTRHDQDGLATILVRLGHTEYSLSNYLGAKKYYKEAVQIRRELVKEQGSPISLRNLCNPLMSLGDTEMAMSNPISAQQYYEESSNIIILLSKEDVPEFKKMFAMILMKLGDCEKSRKNKLQANKYYDQAIEIYGLLYDLQRTHQASGDYYRAMLHARKVNRITIFLVTIYPIKWLINFLLRIRNILNR